MTFHPPHDHLHHPAPSQRRDRRASFAAIAVVAAAAAIGVGVSVASQSDSATAAAPAPTGEINQMGLPVVVTPGAGTGTASAGGVEVNGATWELGTAPLDVAVRPSWVLRNTGTEPVTVGEPHPEVRSGCCPGAFDIDTTTIQPGGTVELSFELSMHAGMDGWHDIAVHVPLYDGTAEQILELGVTGDFTST